MSNGQSVLHLILVTCHDDMQFMWFARLDFMMQINMSDEFALVNLWADKYHGGIKTMESFGPKPPIDTRLAGSFNIMEILRDFLRNLPDPPDDDLEDDGPTHNGLTPN